MQSLPLFDDDAAIAFFGDPAFGDPAFLPFSSDLLKGPGLGSFFALAFDLGILEDLPGLFLFRWECSGVWEGLWPGVVGVRNVYLCAIACDFLL